MFLEPRTGTHSPQGEVADRTSTALLTFAPLAEAGGAEQGQEEQPGTRPWQHIHPLPPETKGWLHCREPRDGNGPGYDQGSSHRAPSQPRQGGAALTSQGSRGWKQLLSSAGQGTKAKPGMVCPLLRHLQKAQNSQQCLELGCPARQQQDSAGSWSTGGSWPEPSTIHTCEHCPGQDIAFPGRLGEKKKEENKVTVHISPQKQH